MKRSTSAKCYAAFAALLATSAIHADVMELNVYQGDAFSNNLNSTAKLFGNRFTAPSTMTLDQGHFYLNLGIGTANMVVSVQADNGSGSPTGVDLATGTLASVGTGAGWRTVSFASPTTLTGGQVYHALIHSSNADSTNRLFVRGTGDSHIGSQSANGAPELNAAYDESTNGGASWYHDTINTQIFGLSSSTTDDAVGMVYHSASYSATSPTKWNGVQFTNTAASGNANSISLRLEKVVSSGAADVNAYLIDATTNAVLGSGVIAPASSPLGTANYTLSFPGSGPAVTQGSKYIIAMESLASNAGAWNMVAGAAANFPADLAPLNFQGSLGSYISASGASLPALAAWTSSDDATSFVDPYFQLNITPAVPEPGTCALLALGGVTLVKRRRR